MASANNQSAPKAASSGGVLKSDYTNAQLYVVVADVAKQARPEHPEKISTRQFDAALPLSDHPSSPSARWIAKRLGHPWPEVVAIALDPKRDVVMTDSAARRPAAEKWLNQRNLYFALRFVARERDEGSFTAIEYADTREQLLAADSHRADSFLGTMLPTRGQITQIVRRLEAQAAEEVAKAQKEAAGTEKAAETSSAAAAGEKPKKKRKSHAKPKKVTAPPLPMIEGDVEKLDEAEELGWWNKALVLAGLQPHEVDYSKGVPVPVAIDLYIDATGLLPPSMGELRRLAKEADFSLSQKPAKDAGENTLRGGSYHVTILRYAPEVAELRAKRGLTMPGEMATKASANPTFDLTKIPPGLPKPIRARGYWESHKDEMIDVLCDYLDTLGSGKRRVATQADYSTEQAKRGREWPAKATFNRFPPEGSTVSGFTSWITAAEAERQKRREQASKQQAA